uniref:Uncharacterized protein n=1 Tax=Utricularia reniformis TaxID=192314 RepID=A0A1Y0B2X0_9LAMI|nr:hypothetical protein AEK19_MT1508 [Utricularia reniformis]ART31699.1 hypothetical protein AEK19_MT1508 [Utricularia reniformis]
MRLAPETKVSSVRTQPAIEKGFPSVHLLSFGFTKASDRPMMKSTWNKKR